MRCSTLTKLQQERSSLLEIQVESTALFLHSDGNGFELLLVFVSVLLCVLRAVQA